MMKTFIINQSVQFDPQNRTLIPLGKPDRKVQLHTPVSECLLLLLKHNGETLSQKFLSDEVWVKKGHYVTTNSLYQNIAAIRRGLRSVGLDESILKTIPKSGFRFYASITEIIEDTSLLLPLEKTEITPLYPAQEKTEITPLHPVQEKTEITPLHPAQEKTEITPLHPSQEKTEITPLHPSQEKTEITPEITIADPKDGSRKKNIISGYFVKVVIFLFAYTTISIFIIHLDILNFGTNFMSTYTHIGIVDKCDLYSSYTGIDKSTRVFRWLMHSWGQNCSQDNQAWLTFNADYRASSILICDVDIEDNDANCKSLVYSGDIHE